MSKHSRQYLQFKDDQSLQVGNAVNRDKNKLSMASALIWKEEVITDGNLRNITSQDSLHATGPDTRGEDSASLAGVRVGAGVQETGSYSLLRGDSLRCAALPGTLTGGGR